MKPLDEQGDEIDAIFSVEQSQEGIALILESRGGGVGGPRAPRNADYARGFELLMQRLGALGATLVDVEIYSRRTRSLPQSERRLVIEGVRFPLVLDDLEDVTALRYRVARASAAFGRAAGRAGGNPTKRLRLNLAWPWANGRDVVELERVLAGAATLDPIGAQGELRYAPLGAYLRDRVEDEIRLRLSEIERLIEGKLPAEARTPQFWANAAGYHTSRRSQWLDNGFKAFYERRTETVLFRREAGPEQPTSDPEELLHRAKAAQRRMRGQRRKLRPPMGNTVVTQSSTTITRYVRDPEVVAWVLLEANGRCEVGGGLAPFLTVDGFPFLEVHHVRPLSEGGPDQIDNAIATCPNCHRKLHYSQDKEAVRTATIAKIPRLKDYAPHAPE